MGAAGAGVVGGARRVSLAALNYGLLVEGICWQCHEPLTHILDWGECVECGRRFQIRGREVTEQIAVEDEWRGKNVCLGAERVLLADGTVIVPPDNGMVHMPWSAEWVVCRWSLR